MAEWLSGWFISRLAHSELSIVPSYWHTRVVKGLATMEVSTKLSLQLTDVSRLLLVIRSCQLIYSDEHQYIMIHLRQGLSVMPHPGISCTVTLQTWDTVTQWYYVIRCPSLPTTVLHVQQWWSVPKIGAGPPVEFTRRAQWRPCPIRAALVVLTFMSYCSLPLLSASLLTGSWHPAEPRRSKSNALSYQQGSRVEK